MVRVLEVEGLKVERQKRELISHFELSLRPGEFVALVGPSGAGKSTILNVLSGEARATSGEVRLLGRDLRQWRPRELAHHRAVLPQSSALSFPFPVLDVVTLGRAPYGTQTTPRDRCIAEKCLQMAGIGHLKDRDYAVLSGGERQRVHFARILSQIEPDREDPRLLLLDEPTSSLDVAHGWSILDVARRLTLRGVAVFCVLHDLNLAARFADRVLILKEGSLLAMGSPREVFTPPLLAQAFGVTAEVIDGPGEDTPMICVSGLSHPDSIALTTGEDYELN